MRYKLAQTLLRTAVRVAPGSVKAHCGWRPGLRYRVIASAPGSGECREQVYQVPEGSRLAEYLARRAA